MDGVQKKVPARYVAAEIFVLGVGEQGKVYIYILKGIKLSVLMVQLWRSLFL